jgi:hypothetical protein
MQIIILIGCILPVSIDLVSYEQCELLLSGHTGGSVTNKKTRQVRGRRFALNR